MTKATELNKQILLNAASQSRADHNRITGTDEEFLHARFMAEYGWQRERCELQKACLDWLQGLALPVPYMNWDIIQLAERAGLRKTAKTKKGQDTIDFRIVESYWRGIAAELARIILKVEKPRTISAGELKYRVENAGHDSHFFDRSTMRFFGDTMRNYGVRDAGKLVCGYGESARLVDCWELYRRRPVKHGNTSSAYFCKATNARVFPAREND